MASAGPVKLQSAKKTAGAFLKEKAGSPTIKSMDLAYRQPVPGNETKTACYIFNSTDGKGYVIVSGDDRTEQVLGYSPTGHIDPAAMPDNMKYYLDELAKEIASMGSAATAPTIAKKSMRRAPVKRAIAPLLTTHWNQDSPFNDMAPTVNNGTKHCVTGCVATAMAQVMNFYKYPKATIAEIPGYTSESYGFKIDSIPAGATIDWDNMADTYDNNSTAAQCAAVAKLMYLCGVSARMDYGPSASGASSSVNPFIKYFGFSNQARLRLKTDYTSLEWFNLIYDELASGYPMYSAGGGHAYVIDGYDGNNMFHFNWGWGPGSDGYYLLSAISEYYPDGNAGNSTSYTSGQDIITGLRIPSDESPMPASTVKLLSCENDSTLNVLVYHPAGLAEEFGIGIGYLKDDLSVVPISAYYDEWPYIANGTVSKKHPFTIRGLSKGSYRVVAIKKSEGSNVWKAGENSDLYFADVTIDDKGTVKTKMYGYTTDIKADTMIFVNDPTFGSNKVQAYITKNTDDGKTFDGDITLYSIKKTIYDEHSWSTSFHELDCKSIIIKDNETKCLDFNAYLSGTYYGGSDADSTFTFRLYQGDFQGKQIGEYKVLVKKPKAQKYSKNLAMTLTPTIESFNAAGNYHYGKTLKMKVKVVNENDSDYVGYVEAKVIIGTRSATDYESIRVPAGGQTEVELDINPYYIPNNTNATWKLELSNYSYISGNIIYSSKESDKIRYSTFEPIEFTHRPGIEVFYDDGSSKCFEATSSYSAPKNATAIDIREQNVLKSLTLANPNCLVFADDTSGTPSGVTANIVKSGKSDNVTLTDGYSFATPEKFTATNISYTRTFTKGYRSDGTGWTTISLPFDVSGVKVKSGSKQTAIDWFHSATDKGKSFWLREFWADDAPMMRFAPADKMLATRPYIISFPDSKSGIGKTLTGKPVTFYGTEATIKPNQHCQTLGYTYRFIGVTSPSTVTMGFGHTDGDTLFVKKSALAVKPFRAYFNPVTSGAQSRASLILAGESKGTSDDPAEQEEKLEFVDLGLSVKWASKNLGALTAERPGQLVSWGELAKKNHYYFDEYEYYNSRFSCKDIGSDISGTQYDAAYSQSGGRYRMPTRAEMQELLDRCTITNEIVNGIDGFRVKGPNGKSIFMPASGFREYSSYIFASDDTKDNKCGFYWTSEPYNSNTSTNAYSLIIGNDGTRSIADFYRYKGLAIRAVMDKGTLLGDMDNNGELSVADITIMVDIILGVREKTAQDISRGDMNGDGDLSLLDIMELSGIIVGNK